MSVHIKNISWTELKNLIYSLGSSLQYSVERAPSFPLPCTKWDQGKVWSSPESRILHFFLPIPRSRGIIIFPEGVTRFQEADYTGTTEDKPYSIGHLFPLISGTDDHKWRAKSHVTSASRALQLRTSSRPTAGFLSRPQGRLCPQHTLVACPFNASSSESSIQILPDGLIARRISTDGLISA